ncbi:MULTISPECIES: sensor domain-containing diguanylate cyclase [unclassified Pseudomonas]|uniref:sensor domain-containing diguanylate cyclase n=1 Tax=unclassified Pseudomonas TaxID=196821 RepID=UPI00244C5E9D|nr:MULTISPECIES: sensor domain-containing diguanylate cyclase [unclassified Pseudomonas]MDH0896427.1 sensor domain-containing diguanylate cyclase [Pseudomonas sp. GD03875]MDH1066824.1 sensor domain-containing diguanylate cyclase [Pseudomonas sp. GD03985]
MRRWWQRPTILSLARIFVVLVCVSLVATDGWLIWKARQVQLRDAEIETSNLAAALARQAGDTLKKADIVLLDLVERLQVDGTRHGQLQRLQGLMRQQVQQQVELHGLFAYDRDGNWLANSFGEIPPGANNADREYFIYHREHPDDHGAHVGVPVRSRTTGDWIIPLSRRVEDDQGNFLGVALATISIDFFRRFYGTFDIRESGSINLALNNGTVLIRVPYTDASIGSSLAHGPIFSQLLPHSPSGTSVFPSIVDGVRRVYSYRQLEEYPLVVVAALAERDILADWREDTNRQLFVVILLASLLALFGFYLLYLIKQSQKAEVELMATRDALRSFNKRLEQQALEDELTRLANRRRFLRALSEEFARAVRSRKPLALVLFDVDYFKQYNDLYGHVVGDECLRQVAEVIRGGQRRPADLAARYGGEEFCLLLPETDAQGALQVAEKIRLALGDRALEHAGSPWRCVSMSAGVAVCQPSPDEPDDGGPERLIQGADRALYAAKAAGRDRVVLHDDKVDQPIG